MLTGHRAGRSERRARLDRQTDVGTPVRPRVAGEPGRLVRLVGQNCGADRRGDQLAGELLGREGADVGQGARGVLGGDGGAVRRCVLDVLPVLLGGPGLVGREEPLVSAIIEDKVADGEGRGEGGCRRRSKGEPGRCSENEGELLTPRSVYACSGLYSVLLRTTAAAIRRARASALLSPASGAGEGAADERGEGGAGVPSVEVAAEWNEGRGSTMGVSMS